MMQSRKLGLSGAHVFAAATFLLVLGSASAGPVLWAGNVTSSSASFRVVGHDGKKFSVSRAQDLSSPVYETTLPTGPASLVVSGLASETIYFYGVSDDIGKFTTFKDGAYNFTVGFSSCARSRSNSVAFRELQNLNLTFFINMGDLHYQDIPTNDEVRFRDAYRMVFDYANPKNFYKSTGIVYVYDDHDFGPNDAVGTSPSRPAAQKTYRENFPHYNLPNTTTADNTGSVYHSFTVGRVRFIVMDTRAEQIPGQQIVSETQLNWVFDELRNHTQYGMVVLVSSQPWIGAEVPADTNWLSFGSTRRRLANFIASNNISNLIMMAGDAHMIAYDDGSNSDYNDVGGSAGFPVFQSASLDRPGSTKGGPYSGGCFAYRIGMTNQYSTMQVTDTGSRICIDVRGFRAADEWTRSQEIASLSLCTPTVKKGSTGAGSCTIPNFPSWAVSGLLVVYLVAGALIVTAIIMISPKKCCAPTAVPRVRLISTIIFAVAIILIVIISVAPNISMPGLNVWPMILAQGIFDAIFLVLLLILAVAWKRS